RSWRKNMANELPLLALILIVAFSGCAKPQLDFAETNLGIDDENIYMPAKSFDEISFATDDGFVISGNLWRGKGDAILLLHILDSSKESYSSFGEKLNAAGFTVLAIDLRGHGSSLEQDGLKRPWRDFSNAEFGRMELDVASAKKFLGQQGFALRHIVGASIGANTALNYSAKDPSVQKLVLLSPGLDYRGVKTKKNAPKVTAKTLIVASEEDAYSFGSSKTLADLIPNAELKELRGAGHGTRMLSGTRLEDEIAQWLNKS
ncbi:MAG: alpha/beta fold hydrolase, partial [archaeon]|nr:alpha/beta fold hydrolase [archaeon]